MNEREIIKLRDQVATMRNILNSMLEGLEKQIEPQAPRQRRNLKAERIKEFAANHAAGTWKKPRL